MYIGLRIFGVLRTMLRPSPECALPINARRIEVHNGAAKIGPAYTPRLSSRRLKMNSITHPLRGVA